MSYSLKFMRVTWRPIFIVLQGKNHMTVNLVIVKIWNFLKENMESEAVERWRHVIECIR